MLRSAATSVAGSRVATPEGTLDVGVRSLARCQQQQKPPTTPIVVDGPCQGDSPLQGLGRCVRSE